jgi:hypothetical protein
MNANLEAVSLYSKQLTEARAALDAEQKVLASLRMANGQDFATSLIVCGKKFALVTMGSNYFPERVKALDVIRLELIKYQEGVVQFHSGAVEGFEFRLAQAARGAAS